MIVWYRSPVTKIYCFIFDVDTSGANDRTCKEATLPNLVADGIASVTDQLLLDQCSERHVFRTIIVIRKEKNRWIIEK